MSRRTKNPIRSETSPAVKTEVKKVLVFAGKLLVSALMLWFVFSKINLASITVLIFASNPWWILAALFLFITSKVVSAYRLNLFFRASGLHLSASLNLRLYLLGMFYNLFLPGGVGGDAYKIILLNKSSSIKLKYIFQATLLDRVTGLIALLMITLILTCFLPLAQYIHLLAVAAVPFTLLVSWLLLRRFFPVFLPVYTKTNLQSAAVQLLQVGSAFCLLMAMGQTEEMLLLLTLFLVSSVMAVMPLTFGGAGAREFTFALAGTLLSFEAGTRDAAIALGMLFYLVTAFTSLAGIWYLFFPIRIRNQG